MFFILFLYRRTQLTVLLHRLFLILVVPFIIICKTDYFYFLTFLPPHLN